MNPLSTDLRERIVKRCLAGDLTQSQVAEQFDVCLRSVSRYLKQYRETGSLQAKPHTGGPPPKLDDLARKKLQGYVEDQPDATLEDLREKMGGVVSVPTVHRVLQDMGARRKKNGSRQ
jgi:transposase